MTIVGVTRPPEGPLSWFVDHQEEQRLPVRIVGRTGAVGAVESLS